MRSIFEKNFLRSSALAMSVRGASAFLGLYWTLLLAKSLGPTGFGVFTFYAALVALLSIPCQLGLPILIVRDTARYISDKSWGLIRGLWIWSFRVSFCISSVVGFFLITLYFMAPRVNAIDYPSLLVYTGILLPLSALIVIVCAAIRGLGKVALGNTPDSVVRQAALISIFMLSTIFYSPSPKMAMISWVFASMFSLFVATIILLKTSPIELLGSKYQSYRKREWWNATLPMAVAVSSSVVIQYSDVLMLGIFTGSEEVGIYRAMISIALPIAMILEVIASVLAPSMATLFTEGKREQLQGLLSRGALLIAVLSLPLIFLILIYDDWIIMKIFGKAYEGGSDSLRVLVVSQLINSLFGPVAVLLNMASRQSRVARGFLLAALVNITLNLWWIPIFGMTGAAYATLVSIFLWNLYLTAYALSDIKLNCTIFSIKH